VLWVQNDWDFRTLGQDIHAFDNKYTLILHASEVFQKQHSGSYFFRMPADPEMYEPTKPCIRFPLTDIVYVSNNIKPYYNEEWIKPLAEHFGVERFTIYGSVWGGSGLEKYCKGAPPGLVVPDIFASSKIILSIHLEDHRKYNVTTCRIPEALLAGKPVISDKVGEDCYGDYVYYGDNGKHLIELSEYILQNYDKAKEKALLGRDFVLNNHTFKHRVNELLNYINNLN
jgi:spore maturation protein CgeB